MRVGDLAGKLYTREGTSAQGRVMIIRHSLITRLTVKLVSRSVSRIEGTFQRAFPRREPLRKALSRVRSSNHFVHFANRIALDPLHI